MAVENRDIRISLINNHDIVSLKNLVKEEDINKEFDIFFEEYPRTLLNYALEYNYDYMIPGKEYIEDRGKFLKEFLPLIYKNGGDFNKIGSMGFAPLDNHVYINHSYIKDFSIIKLLIEYGSNINSLVINDDGDNEKTTLLIYYVKKLENLFRGYHKEHYINFITYLIDNGIDYNKIIVDGDKRITAYNIIENMETMKLLIKLTRCRGKTLDTRTSDEIFRDELFYNIQKYKYPHFSKDVQNIINQFL